MKTKRLWTITLALLKCQTISSFTHRWNGWNSWLLSLIPYTLYPIPYTLYPILYILYPISYTLSLLPYTYFPIPSHLSPTPSSLFPFSPLHSSLQDMKLLSAVEENRMGKKVREVLSTSRAERESGERRESDLFLKALSFVAQYGLQGGTRWVTPLPSLPQ